MNKNRTMTTAVVFALCCCPAFAEPKVFWKSEPATPGESVLVVGSELQDISNIQVSQLSFGEDRCSFTGKSYGAEISQKTDQSIKFVLPEQLNPGVYCVQLSAAQTVLSMHLNLANVYWAQGDRGSWSTPGGWLRVLGRNIVRKDTAELVATNKTDGTVVQFTSVRQSLWDATFSIPQNIRAGRYQIQIWNGDGSKKISSEVGELDIRAAEQPFVGKFSVKDYGAIGDGIQDDSAAVNRALSAIEIKGGGIIHFPRGRYLLSGKIVLSRHVTLKGEGRDLSSIVWTDFQSPPTSLIEGQSDFSIEDISLYASRHAHIISGGFSSSAEPGKNIAIRRILIRASEFFGHPKLEEIIGKTSELMKNSNIEHDSIRLKGDNLIIEDSDIYSSGRALYLLNARNAVISRNKLYNGRHGWYCITGAENLIFEENDISGADLQSIGGGINTLSAEASYSRNVAFLRNRFARFMGWDREAITSDGPGGFYYGVVKSFSDGRLRLGGAASFLNGQRSWVGAGFFILDGKGKGQYARVTALDDTMLTLERLLPVMPDDTSTVTVVPMQENYLIIGNYFEDAGQAVQFYGTSVNHIVAENVSSRTGGYLTRGMWYKHFQPSWYIQFLDNKILDGNVYRGGSDNSIFSGEAVIGAYGHPKTPNKSPLSLGVIIKGNYLRSNAHIEVMGNGDGTNPSVNDVVVEGNIIEKSSFGVVYDRGVAGLLIRNNAFREVRTPISPRPLQ